MYIDKTPVETIRKQANNRYGLAGLGERVSPRLRELPPAAKTESGGGIHAT